MPMYNLVLERKECPGKQLQQDTPELGQLHKARLVPQGREPGKWVNLQELRDARQEHDEPAALRPLVEQRQALEREPAQGRASSEHQPAI